MNTLNVCRNAGQIYLLYAKRAAALSVISRQNSSGIISEDDIVDPPDNLELASLNYERRRNDPIHIKKARLIYQSRKRGMLENGILLSNFAAKYLTSMTEAQIDEYDKIINLPSNDWDIFYWAMGMKPIPEEFNNSVMHMLKEHLKVHGKEDTFLQPPVTPV